MAHKKATSNKNSRNQYFAMRRKEQNKIRRIYRSSGRTAAMNYAEKYNMMGYFNAWDREKSEE